jgi:hypothetical protein
MAGLVGIAVKGLMDMEIQGPSWALLLHAMVVVAITAMVIAGIAQHVRQPTIITMPPNVPREEATVALSFYLILVATWVALYAISWIGSTSLWGVNHTSLGSVMGLLFLCVTLSLGQSVSAAFTEPTSPFKPFNVAATQPAIGLLAKTIGEVGALSVGQPAEPGITVLGDDSVLAWGLREFREVTYVQVLDPSVNTIMVITPADTENPTLGSEYVGQDFVTRRRWSPTGLLPAQVVWWAIYHRAITPPNDERIILWVREDVYSLSEPGISTAP